jgi:hypothetical protein
VHKPRARPITKYPGLGRIRSAERITPDEPEQSGNGQSTEDDEDPGDTRPDPGIGPIHSLTYRPTAARPQVLPLLAELNLDNPGEGLRVGVSAPAFVDGDGHAKVLNRQPRRVEDRDVVLGLSSLSCSGQDVA